MTNDAEPTGLGVAQDPAAESGEGPGLARRITPGLLLLFIVGDILGTGVYALTGKVAKEIGGAVWLPFLCAFVVAILTAMSYLELVTKYPRAGGAAVYAHRAFGAHFVTFLVAFTVMCSGLTSASSASKAFASNLAKVGGLDWKPASAGILALSLLFICLVAAINLRGVSESVKTNVVLTVIELTGLVIIITVGMTALASGKGDTSQLTRIDVPAGESVFGAVTAATALAFFAMVGFEDSVNMAEETKDPSRTFPKIMLTGMVITGVVYLLVAVSAISLVSSQELGEGDTPLLKVLQAGAPWFPVGVFAGITVFAVANTALLNMLMASRLLYGMAQERVVPAGLGRISRRRTPWVAIIFTTLLAMALIWFADLQALGGTTAFLLLVVFTVVNVSVLVLRKDKVEHEHFRAPTIVPIIGGLSAAFLASPFSGRAAQDFVIGGWLLVLGVVLWGLTSLLNRYLRRTSALEHPEQYGGHQDELRKQREGRPYT
ncbi:MAG: APC family permease [Austwickia sp.]|nr:APC family permease [Austwickia sp.]MCO5309088.1 APC family permease [Austwickia sp.]